MSQNLRVSELDFDNIKQNLVDFLRSKPEFTDYDFTGSGLNVILNLLAYNTHYNGVIANMLAGESFLDTAVKRETVAMHAHRLGYTPRSARSAYAIIDIEVFPTDSPASITLRRGSLFTSTVGSSVLSFNNRDSYVTYRTDNRYIFRDVVIHEGTLTQFKYLVLPQNTSHKFEVQSDVVDMSTLRVRVQKSATNTETIDYTYCQDIIGKTRDSKIFFTRMNERGRYEIYFGDGVIGHKIEDGNIVILDYVITNKSIGNYAKNFRFDDNADGYSNAIVTTKISAIGGSEAESIDDIRKSALSSVLANNRAVTEDDFEVLIPNTFPVESVSTWGGEVNDPPIYGKVFISVKLPNTTEKLSAEMRNEIKREIDKKKILAIQTEIVDPEYMYIVLDSVVSFDPRKTSLSAGSIESTVFLKLKSFLSNNLNKFSSVFHYSTTISEIDSMEGSIISNQTKVGLKKILVPKLGQDSHYHISFMSELVNGSIKSTPIQVYGSAEQLFIGDNDGILFLYTIINGEVVTRNSNVGTIDYINGKLTIPKMNISSFSGTNIGVYGSPVSFDVRPKRNMILTFTDSDLTIKSKVETT
jgi:hypothetical protein